jgi:hypothetical protein
MHNRFIPFRPRLEGIFLSRFREKSQLFNKQITIDEIENIVEQEVKWATNTCKVNARQRKIYRAIWLLLRDLIRTGWIYRINLGEIELSLPERSNVFKNYKEMQEAKEVLRNCMSYGKQERISESKDFIKRMEKPPKGSLVKFPINVLIADGKELASNLNDISKIPDKKEQLDKLKSTVKPYLQLVNEYERDEFTGHKLGDIWRYFRLTWSSPSESTPGRTLSYLIRDAARPFNPVMGIASLENCPAQITCRDEYIGWTLKSFIKEVKSYQDMKLRMEAFQRLLEYIKQAIGGINVEDLCAADECEVPTKPLIERLTGIALKSKLEMTEALKKTKRLKNIEKLSNYENIIKIKATAEEKLYKRKRADQLAQLLSARYQIQHLLESETFESDWIKFTNSEHGQTAIRMAILAIKKQHIGNSILELNVCGAIPPYNELLVGKLVALLSLSSQVVRDYRMRYSNKHSEIATKLKGEPVIRPTNLVFIGTTSLYHIGASQYNRLRIPHGVLGESSPEVKWRYLGQTTGYGTMHISKQTLKSMEEAIFTEGYKDMNNFFAECHSSKLRLINRAVRELLEHTQYRSSQEFSKHSMSRLVYGAWIAVDGQAYLCGNTDKPTYIFNINEPVEEISQRIINYWMERWLLNRINYKEAIDRISKFNINEFLVSQSLSETSSIVMEPIRGEYKLLSEDSLNQSNERMDYIRNLYRGTSAYADYMSSELLSEIHVETALDKMVIEALNNNRSIILTGNPGDGKTHLLRILGSVLEKMDRKPVVEYDASRLHDSEIYEKLESSMEIGVPFCIAINEAVFFDLCEKYPNLKPLIEAKKQIEKAIQYKDEHNKITDVEVYDLSLRDVLSKEIVNDVIDHISKILLSNNCNKCIAAETCDFKAHMKLLNSNLVRERIQLILDRVSRRGYHATLREVQAFISYLLFGGRECSELIRSSGDENFSLSELIYSGEGKLFDSIRQTFDPVNISHPVWDERIVNGTVTEGWVADWKNTQPNIDADNWKRFKSMKRTFFFFNKSGGQLLDVASDDETEFGNFLKQNEKEGLKTIIRRINLFFGDESSVNSIRVWQSHRYNQSPRRILYSLTEREKQEFELVTPRLSKQMSKAFNTSKDHVLLRLKRQNSVALKIDFKLFQLLYQAEQGLPVMCIDNDVTRRLWQFMEQLTKELDLTIDNEPKVYLYDPISKEKLLVRLDYEAKQYTGLSSWGE